ncbi:MAG: M28 family peptidase [Sphingobacteriia bacterium]|nr:M28 family peptidase [Sphingobacteriia bacterium]
MRKLLVPVLLLPAIMATAQTENAEKYAGYITPSALKEKLSILASADMEGRETATPGQKKAAAYIEAQFKRMGLKPGNGDSYQQHYPVYQDEVNSKTFSVNGKQFEWDKDYVFSFSTMSSGSQKLNDIVFVGYGLDDAANKINDYEGLDVKGKLVMVLEGLPETHPAAKAAPSRTSPGSVFAKINAARNKGAAGIIVVSKDFPRKTATPLKGNMYLTKPAGNTNFSVITVSEDVATALTGRMQKQSLAQLKELIKGKYVSEVVIGLDKTTADLQSSNVIAVLPGTDKANEYVFITGHYDHLGKRGDVIYYGADDDGSGTTAVMQMAEAFSKTKGKDKPRRTMVFMTVSGEEKGLWGSQYYSEHPIYSLDKTSVDLNIDMVGRTDTERKTADSLNYIYVIGHDKLSSELPIINEAVNNEHTKLTLDYKYDDPKDRNQIYYRSDHYNFARKGVPVLFFYDGMLLADYHQPTDTVDKINFDLMAKRAQLVFYTAWVMANKEEMLKRDTPLNMPSTR